MAYGKPLWKELQIIRRGINLGQQQSRMNRQLSLERPEHLQNVDSIHFMALPYFYAFSSSMFNLC